MTDPTAWLDERQRLADEATPGPWKRIGAGVTTYELRTSDDESVEADDYNLPFIADARASVPVMVAALRAVLELHHRRRRHFLMDPIVFGQTEFPDLCDHCRQTWPCDTITALTRPLNTEKEN